ncbi:MAG: DUF4159 domain-containing protein [Isosphaeraceae bacterium]
MNAPLVLGTPPGGSIMSGWYASIRRLLLAVTILALGAAGARAGVTSEQVEHAIREGVRFLRSQQHPDGSWTDAEAQVKTGTTSLVTLALLTAGEPVESPTIQNALTYLRGYGPQQLRNTYGIGLQTMVFAAAEPERDHVRLVANVDWLEQAQIKPGDRVAWPGTWTYTEAKGQSGDHSNTQYALLGLNAASEAGIVVKPEVWELSRSHFEQYQNRDGGWSYTPRHGMSTGSMTCAGISSLIISGSRRFQGAEILQGETIRNCGRGTANRPLSRALDWLAAHFQVGQNIPQGQVWKFYYLYGMERAGRLAGVRFFGRNDWYRLGAEELVHLQHPLSGFWRGAGQENELVGTSFALLFLAKGRAPVLINKLVHQPSSDWNNDPDDVRNLVGAVSKDWKHLLTWQIVEPSSASVEDLLQAPILFFNGHEAPAFSPEAIRNIRSYIEQGGFLFVDACCSSPEFDRGFRRLIEEILPPPEFQLRPLPPEHPIWRARYLLSPDVHPLWGIEHGCRTVAVYSPRDLSCYWNQAEINPTNTAVIRSMKIAQNVVDYATGREMPADKLVAREVHNLQPGAGPKRGALQIAKLRYAGEWNIAPQAIPNLMDALHKAPFKFAVHLSQKDLSPRDKEMTRYPLIYLHGRGSFSFPKEDLEALRRHLDPSAGTLFADAACGNAAFDAAFRRFAAELFPDHRLEPIPRNDEIYNLQGGFNLHDCQYTKAAGGGKDFPQLEGVRINGHWAIIYSKLDLGCALERHTGIDCKGYNYESAVRIAGNIVIYSTFP